MNIRKAVTGDLDRIYEITLLSFGPYCAAQAIKERYDIGGGVKDKAASVRRFCEQNLDKVFVAEDERGVAGYSSHCACEEYGTRQIGANAVDPEYQGRGIGTLLVNRVVRELVEAESHEILFVSTMVHDCPARRVYEKVGFTEVSRQSGYSTWKHLLNAGGPDAEPGDAAIRTSEQSDLERICDIAIRDPMALFSREKIIEDRFGLLGGKSWQQRCQEEVRSEWEAESSEFLVAERDGRVVGYAASALRNGSEFSSVTFPRVDPELEHPRLRSQLLAHSIARLNGEESARIVDVSVAATDDGLGKICEEIGFEEFSTGIGYAMWSKDAVYA